MSASNGNYNWLQDDGPAFGSPGITPRWTSSQKDAVITAYAASTRIWFTMSHGIINEVYYPTIDHPQTRDMELLFTDGESFFHEEKRDLRYDFHYVDEDALAIRMAGHDVSGRYSVTKELITDPHHAVVLMNVKISGDEDLLSRLKCYALLAPHLDGGGVGNSARSLSIAGRRCVLAWKNEFSLALGVDCGFERSSCGYVGASDGYSDLSEHLRMTWNFGQALDGNVAMMGEIDVARHREFTLAVALGRGHHSALSSLMQSLSIPFLRHRDRFIAEWHRAKAPAALAEVSTDDGKLMRTSHAMILAHEDKTYAGAYIASASIPWGASKSDDDKGGYHLVWTRDMVQSATALLACGRVEAARGALVYLACTQHPNGGFAQNFWVNGLPYWSGIQLDEVGFPIILAWRLWKMDGLGKFDIVPFVLGAASFLVRYAPITQQERWEENAGYSPSTLAVVIASLVCAADILHHHESEEAAVFLQEFADWIEARVDRWTTTKDGVLLEGVPYHYIRIRPPAAGESFHNQRIPRGMILIPNRGPEEEYAFEAREVVDAGFLELVRYGIRRADDPLVVDSLKVIDSTLKVITPYGPCWRRYNHDGYGQRKDGGPYQGWGQGRAWPILTGERAHYELAAGHDVRPYITALESFSSVGRMLPEQIWDRADLPSEEMYFGRAAGSAQPLVWAHAEYLKLLRSVKDNQVFDRIPVVYDRYVAKRDQQTFHRHLAIFQLGRPISVVAQGGTLRVLDARWFTLVYSVDQWANKIEKHAHSLGRLGSFVDIPIGQHQAGSIVFTIHWRESGPDQPEWLGRNYEVVIHSQAEIQGGIADKPKF
ncbi:MAG: glycoside hydrolase family 15 protein [Acidobacteriaceae bacterium]